MTFTEAWLTGPHSTEIYTRFYPAHMNPLKACVIFAHGFIEHIVRYEATHTAYGAAGVAVFAFDQRGFGRTATDVAYKSKGSAYGKTSWNEHLADLEWAIQYAQKENNYDVPLFLMGHSMGGSIALSFVTRTGAPPEKSTVDLLSGVIATSPLILPGTPVSKVSRWVGGKLSKLAPYVLIPAEVKPEQLSHDKAVNDAYMKDPLVIQSGSLRGISDMLNGGEELLSTGYQHWPKELPLLLLHGTEDKVTSLKASQQFHDSIVATDKKISLYEGGYHELHNEPDGVKEKMLEECLAWIEEEVSKLKRAKGGSKL